MTAIVLYESTPAAEAFVIDLHGVADGGVSAPDGGHDTPIALNSPSAIDFNLVTDDAVIAGDDGVGILAAPYSGSSTIILHPGLVGTTKAGVAVSPDGARAIRVNEDGPPLLIRPNVGPVEGGTTVTIEGLEFVPDAGPADGGTSVSFGGVAATGVVVLGPNLLTAVTPPNDAGPVDVVLTNPSTTALAGYTYLTLATLSQVQPAFGPTAGGTSFTLTGTAFQAGAAVSFGGLPALAARLRRHRGPAVPAPLLSRTQAKLQLPLASLRRRRRQPDLNRRPARTAPARAHCSASLSPLSAAAGSPPA